nr:hypothetical protein [Tanacetum cinerariifolium]
FPHGLLGSSHVLKHHREDSTETLVAPSSAGNNQIHSYIVSLDWIGMLKRYRDDLGDSSEPMVVDSSTPTCGLADGKEEDDHLGKSSKSEKVAPTFGHS